MLITCVIWMRIDVDIHGQGRVTWRTTRFLPIKLFCQSFCICSGVVVLAMEVQRFLVTITWSFIVQTLKILTDAYISRIVRGQSRLKDVIERCFWNGLSREHLKAVKASYALKATKALYVLYAKYAKYANVLVEKRTLVEKRKIWNLKSETKLHILYAIYWTTLLPWDWRTKFKWMQTACETSD